MINQSRDVASPPVKPRAPLVPGQIFSTTTGASIDPTGARRGFDFRHYWHSLVEKIWVVALCVVAGLFLGLGYLATTPKLYQGHSVLEVEMEEPSLIESDRASARGARDFLSSEQALRDHLGSEHEWDSSIAPYYLFWLRGDGPDRPQ